MAQKQKSVQLPVASGRKLSKKKAFLLVLLALVLVGCLVYAWRVYQSQKRFAYAEQKKDEIVQELVKELGDNVVSTRVQNECFEAEQQPYFGGTLWCQTATVIKLKTDIDYQSVGKLYLGIGGKYGKTYDQKSETEHRFTVRLDSGASCDIKYTDTSGTRYGSVMRIPYNDSNRPVLAVACANHAATKHYPYKD